MRKLGSATGARRDPAGPSLHDTTKQAPEHQRRRLRSHLWSGTGSASRFAGTLTLAGIAAFTAGASDLLSDAQQLDFLRAFTVFVAAFLPAYLFLRFLSFRAGTLWDEYVLNLHRLGMDDCAHLPVPPKNSIYYPKWEKAIRRRGHSASPLGAKTIYQLKFEAYYGKIVTREMASREPSNDDEVIRRERRAQIGGLFPVMLFTAIAAVGWSAVIRDPQFLTAPDAELVDALRFGFLGAYAFILQMLLRRFFQSDLKTSAYTAAAVRILCVLLLVGVLYWQWADDFAPATVVALAFVVGFFPLVGMQALQGIAKHSLRILVPSLNTDYPLSDLDGLNIWYEARLVEEGIEDMENLATANLVDVILHTRVPVGRLVDWIDQAHLYLHVDPPARWYQVRRRKRGDDPRDRLRRLGIRTATDLQIAFEPHDAHTNGRSWISQSEDKQLREALRWALNAEGEDSARTSPSVTQSILKTFQNDPNLLHVKSWKKNWTVDEAHTRAAVPKLNGSSANAHGPMGQRT